MTGLYHLLSVYYYQNSTNTIIKGTMTIQELLEGRNRVDCNTYFGDDFKLDLTFTGVDLEAYEITWEVFRKFQSEPSHAWTLADGLTIDGETLVSSAMDRNITEALGPGHHRHHIRFDDGKRRTFLNGRVNVSDVHVDRSGPGEFDSKSFSST